MRLRIILPLLLIGCLITPSYAFTLVNVKWTLAPKKTMTLRVPSCWKKSVETSKAPANYYGTLIFTDHCTTRKPLTALKISTGDLPPTLAHPDALYNLVKKTGLVFMKQAKEKKLKTKPLNSTQAEGYYYTLTDKQEKLGEYLYMTQGAINLDGQLLLLFSYLHHKNDAKTMKTVIKALRSIKLRK